jgi:hypothetical protein
MTFALALRYWYIIAIAALVVGLGVQTWRVGNLKDDLKLERVEAARTLDQCHANVATLDQGLTAANASVQRLKDAAEADAKANRARQMAAQAQTADARRQVSALMARKPSGDLCGSAYTLMREN